MPRGPQGQKRSADVIGNVVCVMRSAPGEEIAGGEAKNVRAQEVQ
jgi:hypothetical protein